MDNYSLKEYELTSTELVSDLECGKGKGKAIQLQALTVPEGSRRLRLPDFKTIGK
jgi:hypothetical protein